MSERSLKMCNLRVELKFMHEKLLLAWLLWNGNEGLSEGSKGSNGSFYKTQEFLNSTKNLNLHENSLKFS